MPPPGPTTKIYTGDALKVLRKLDAGSVQCVVTSPPYWGLRDYGVAGQLGLEATPEAYTARMVEVFAEVRRVLRDDGTLWLNLGDSYAAGACGGSKVGLHNTLQTGSPSGYHSRPKTENEIARPRPIPPGLKPKDLVGIPWRVGFALQADGWYLRSDIIWHKPNPMPESVRDRPTKAHEYVFLLSKSERYFYDAEAVRENTDSAPDIRLRASTFKQAALVGNHHQGAEVLSIVGRNVRSVWTITPKPFKGAHFAVMPTALVERCIKAGSRPGDVVLDPFAGAGTVAMVAKSLGRHAIGIDLNPAYVRMARRRISEAVPRLETT